MRKVKWSCIILILSLINWVPVLLYAGLRVPEQRIWFILLPACLATPAAAAAYLIAAVVLMLRRKMGLVPCAAAVVVNVIYLLWGLPGLMIILTAA